MKKHTALKNKLFWMVLVFGLTFINTNLIDSARADSTSRLGAGVHYWVALDDIDLDNVDEDGYSFIFSYQNIRAGFFKFEADLGMLQKGYAGADTTVWSPQAYFLVGKGIYGGVGVGINYSDGDFAKNPFYALRVGFDLEVLPSIFLDLNANYRFENWNFNRIKEDVSTDTVTMGAVLRLEF
jgi:hypothetical protein